jgi:hypothetical protein
MLEGVWNAFAGQNKFRAQDVNYDPTNSNQARQGAQDAAGQMGQSGDYYNALMGNQPSLAQDQLRAGIAQNNTLQGQSAAGVRGMDRSAAFRNAQNNAAMNNAQGALANGQLGLQQQEVGAQGNLAAQQNIAASQNANRQQDINEQMGIIGQQTQRYGINAGITDQNAKNQQQAGGGVMSMIGGGLGAAMMSDIKNKSEVKPLDAEHFRGTAADPAVQQMIADRQQQLIAQANSDQGTQAQQQRPQQQQYQGPIAQGGQDLMAGFMKQSQAGGNAPAGDDWGIQLSDKREKSDVRPWSDNIEPYTFRYDDDFAKKKAAEAAAVTYADALKPREGVMAQELQASPETRDMVVKTPDGLGLDRDRALGHLMAGQSDLHQRLAALEGETKGRRAPVKGP